MSNNPFEKLELAYRGCPPREAAIDAVLQSASGPHVTFNPCLVEPEADGYTVEVNMRLCVAATVPAIVTELRRIIDAIEEPAQ